MGVVSKLQFIKMMVVDDWNWFNSQVDLLTRLRSGRTCPTWSSSKTVSRDWAWAQIHTWPLWSSNTSGNTSQLWVWVQLDLGVFYPRNNSDDVNNNGIFNYWFWNGFFYFFHRLKNCYFHVDTMRMIIFSFDRCCSVRAIENNSISDTQMLNTYWLVLSLILLFEHAFLKLLEW